MCEMTGYDVRYGVGEPEIVDHYCRSLSCGGGMNMLEALESVALWYEHYSRKYQKKATECRAKQYKLREVDDV